MNYFSDLLSELFWRLPVSSTLAQNVTDPDVLGQMQHGWNHFVKTAKFGRC